MNNLRYTGVVTSKKGVIGFDSPKHRCDASRSFSFAESAAFLLRLQFLWWLDGRPKGLPVRASGARSVNPSSYRPCLTAGAVVVSNSTAWRPTWL
jgi:hypothetical protein